MENNFTLVIDKLDNQLDGVSYVKGTRYVVAGALPKERVVVKEDKTYENIHYCNLIKVTEPSPDRVNPACKYSSSCGNCNLMFMSYKAQLDFKTALVKRRLLSFKTEVVPCFSGGQFSLRNKAHLVFGLQDQKVIAGFFNEDTHEVVDIPICLMHDKWYSALVKILQNWITENNITIYNPKTCKGALRFAVVRRLGKAMQITFVTTVSKLEGLDGLYVKLYETFGEISMWININSERTNEVFAGKFQHVAGGERLEGEMMGIKYSLSPVSFFQVNEKVTAEIYNRILSVVEESGAECVVDGYSGIGIVSMLLAKAGKKVVSVEIVKEAVSDAKTLAKQNGVEDNIELFCGDSKDILPTLKVPQNTAFFVDPPRKGLGEEVVNAICKFAPKTVLYLSCNLDTLVPDLTVFTANGYTASKAYVYDMFANTRHLEILVCLSAVK